MTGQYTDVSQVEKFEMTPEEYERRQGMSRAPARYIRTILRVSEFYYL